jgi:hypothetical protein
LSVFQFFFCSVSVFVLRKFGVRIGFDLLQNRNTVITEELSHPWALLRISLVHLVPSAHLNILAHKTLPKNIHKHAIYPGPKGIHEYPASLSSQWPHPQDPLDLSRLTVVAAAVGRFHGSVAERIRVDLPTWI